MAAENTLPGVDPVGNQVPITPLKAGRERRPSFVLIGLALVLLAALAGALLIRSVSTTVPVVALRSDIREGSVVAAEDLKSVEINPTPELQYVSFTDRDQLIGRLATADLVAGQLATTQMFSERLDKIGADRVVVSLALGPGQMPAATIGDEVNLYMTGDSSAGEDRAAELVTSAEVWRFDPAGVGSGIVVELLVDRSNEAVITEAISSGSIRINLVGQG